MDQPRRIKLRLFSIAAVALAMPAAAGITVYSANAGPADDASVQVGVLARAARAGDDIPAELDPNDVLAEGTERLLYASPNGRTWAGTNDEHGVCLLSEMRVGADWAAAIACDAAGLLPTNGLQLELELLGTKRALLLVPDHVDAMLRDAGRDAAADRLAPNLIELAAGDAEPATVVVDGVPFTLGVQR